MTRPAIRWWLVIAALVCVPAASVAAPAVPGELIVRWRAGVAPDARRSVRAVVRAAVVRDLGLIHAEQMRLPAGADLDATLATLRADPRVEYAEPNYVLHADAVPDDSLFTQQWGLHNTGQTGGTPGADIQATAAWDRFTGAQDVRIGVLDTGVDLTHPDLVANLWTNPGEIPGNGIDDDGNGYIDDVHGWDCVHNDPEPADGNGHGTHCAGIIAAAGNNGTGVCGVVWRASIVPIQILDEHGAGDVATAIAGLQYAVAAGVRLTSNSWGGPSLSNALEDAIVAAGEQHGELFVCAAGNSNRNIDAIPDYPSAFDTPWIVSVAASTDKDSLASFSNWGATRVDLAAPGVSVLSLAPGGGYVRLSGTSMAAPFVAGALALAIGRFPDADPLVLRDRLLAAVDPVPAMAGRVASGGRLNVDRLLANADVIAPGPIADVSVISTGSTHVTLAFTATGNDGTSGRAASYDVRVATAPIASDSAFAAAMRMPAPAPRTSGARDTIEIDSLAYATSYWIALRARDAFGNAGPRSNVVTTTTLGAPRLDLTTDPVAVTVYAGGIATRTLAIRNGGEGTLDFAIPPPVLDGGGAAPGAIQAAWGPSTGGPDAAGYEWIDNNGGPAGPAFAWDEITWTTTPLPLTGDDVLSGPEPIGFSFPFYDSLFDNVYVCTNGWLAFAPSAPVGANQALPSPLAPPWMIAPLWDDFDLGDTPRIYLANFPDRCVITWQGVTGTRKGPHTFQVILYPNGEIRLQYDLVGRDFRSCTVGIQNGTGSTGLLLSYNDEYPMTGLAVRLFTRPRWIAPTPARGRVDAGAVADVALRYDATSLVPGTRSGTVTLATNDRDQRQIVLPVSLTVLDAPDLRVLPPHVTLDTLAAGGTAQATLRLYNPGTLPLNVTGVTSDDPDVTIDVPDATLPPGHSTARIVTFAGGAPGVHRGALHFASNDPDAPEVAVPFEGVVRTPPPPDAVALRLAGRSPGPEAAFEIALPQAGRARALVYDARGARIRTVIDEDVPAGVHMLRWDGRDAHGHTAPQGIYFVRLSGGGATRVVRFVLLR